MRLYGKCRKVCSLIKNGKLIETMGNFMGRKRMQEKIFHIIQNYHIVSKQEFEIQREALWKQKPLISIITPLYNTPKEFLEQLLKSVLTQTYTNWELCLADGSDAGHSYVETVCKGYKDSRIHYHKLDRNEGIVGNTNQCISFAKGEYFGLLDHDDVLHPSALYEAVKAAQTGADFIYTDEMKFSGRIENSMDIVCKNDFSRYELRAHNYICHFVVFKSQLLDDMEELYRAKCEGSQDYDMVLRLTERAKKIVHIPKLLYYWRVHEGSVAMDLSVKQYAVDAAKTAISDHLKRCNETGKVECNYPYETIYRLTYEMEKLPCITIIWNGNISIHKQRKCLHQMIENIDYPSVEIICKGKENKRLSAHGIRLKVVREQKICRYVWADQMSKKAEGELLLFMDWSWVPQNRGWLREMAMYAAKTDVGAVGPFVKDRLGRTVSAGAMLDVQSRNGLRKLNQGMDAAEQGYEANMRHVRGTAALPGYCLMVSKSAYEGTGGFDAAMHDCADADLCLKLKAAGMENVWTPFAEVLSAERVHYWEEENVTFTGKWICCLKGSAQDENSGYWCHPLLKQLNYI